MALGGAEGAAQSDLGAALEHGDEGIAVSFGDDSRRRLAIALGAQTALVAAAIGVAAFAGHHLAADARYAPIAVLAVAMGIQNAAARRLAVAALTTTVLTPTLTGLASESKLVGGSGAKLAAVASPSCQCCSAPSSVACSLSRSMTRRH